MWQNPIHVTTRNSFDFIILDFFGNNTHHVSAVWVHLQISGGTAQVSAERLLQEGVSPDPPS
jgi:hypothetical protein